MRFVLSHDEKMVDGMFVNGIFVGDAITDDSTQLFYNIASALGAKVVEEWTGEDEVFDGDTQ